MKGFKMIDDIKKIWDTWEQYKEHAEQHDFTKILYFDLQLTPLYNDLTKNWDDSHALIFIKNIKHVFSLFGITSEEVNKYEF